MTTEKLRSAFQIYLLLAEEYGFRACESPAMPTGLPHLAYMATKCLEEFIPAGRIEKAMRWLGFIQGALVCQKYYTLEDVKRHVMPDDAQYQ